MSRLRSRPAEAVDPPDLAALPPLEALALRRERRREADARRRRRMRKRLIAAPLLVMLAWAIVSYTRWMLQPTSEPFGIRSVEWVRAELPLGNWLADHVEQVYYSSQAPKRGGPQLHRLPVIGVAPRATPRHRARALRTGVAGPPRIRLVFPNALPGEGVWRASGPPVAGGSPVLLTTFRPELDYPRVVAYVAWFDHTRSTIAYYPGRYEPPRAAVRGPMMVPLGQRSRLLATFNAGFTSVDGHNGSSDNGLVNEPLTAGNATLVGLRNGRIEIVRWSGGAPGPDVAWTRQSLAPIVWNGRLNPDLNTNPNSPQWGYSLGSATRVWRTGVGVDRHGNLLYVAANDQTVVSLAKILQHIGAVRAMEFDINPEWHTLITYTHDHGLTPTLVEPQPMQSPKRYLVVDDRDFFAVYRRRPGPITVPFS